MSEPINTPIPASTVPLPAVMTTAAFNAEWRRYARIADAIAADPIELGSMDLISKEPSVTLTTPESDVQVMVGGDGHLGLSNDSGVSYQDVSRSDAARALDVDEGDLATALMWATNGLHAAQPHAAAALERPQDLSHVPGESELAQAAFRVEWDRYRSSHATQLEAHENGSLIASTAPTITLTSPASEAAAQRDGSIPGVIVTDNGFLETVAADGTWRMIEMGDAASLLGTSVDELRAAAQAAVVGLEAAQPYGQRAESARSADAASRGHAINPGDEQMYEQYLEDEHRYEQIVDPPDRWEVSGDHDRMSDIESGPQDTADAMTPRLEAQWVSTVSEVNTYVAHGLSDALRARLDELDTNLQAWQDGEVPPDSDEMYGVYNDAIDRSAIPYGIPPISISDLADELRSVGVSVPDFDPSEVGQRLDIHPTSEPAIARTLGAEAAPEAEAAQEGATKAEAEVTIYSVPDCGGCYATKAALDKAGIVYDEIDLSEHPDLLETFKQQGLMRAPIVEAEGDRWSGFNPSKLQEHHLDYRSRQNRGNENTGGIER